MTMFAEKHDCPTCRCTEPIEVKEPAMTDLDDLIAYAEAHVSCKFDAAILARLVSLRDAEKELPGEPMRYSKNFSDASGLSFARPVVLAEDYDALRAHAVAAEAEREAMMAKLREPTEEMLMAALEDSGIKYEPFSPATECGVPIECGLSQEDADFANRKLCKEFAATFRAMSAELLRQIEGNK